MSENSRAPGSGQRPGSSRRGYRNGNFRGGPNYDHNAPPDPSHRGPQPANQWRQNSSPNPSQQPREAEPRRQGGNDYEGRFHRREVAKEVGRGRSATHHRGLSRLAMQRRSPPSSPQRPSAGRDRLFEDYARPPPQPAAQPSRRPAQQRQDRGQQREDQRSWRQPADQEQSGHQDQRHRQGKPRTRQGRGRLGPGSRSRGSPERPAEDEVQDGIPGSDNGSRGDGANRRFNQKRSLPEQRSNLNVHAEEFMPSAVLPGGAATGHATENSMFGGHSSRESETNFRSSARPADGDAKAKVMAMALAQANRGQSLRSPAVRRKPTEESKAQKESLEEQLLRGTYDCLICCSRVRANQQVWNCQSCFHIFHLRCVSEWAQKSISADEQTWRCPACQGEKTILPLQYLCFCGKRKNPQPNKASVPHSCNELCLKPRTCPHKCNKLCHPGRCPPCEATAPRQCECGKTESLVKCSSKNVVRCDQPCAKTLDCGKHSCTAICHGGECAACEERKEARCFCGRKDRQVLCAESGDFSCKEPCGRLMACGNHSCRKECHLPEHCDLCQLSLKKFCPCGKQPLPDDWDCSKPIPLCGARCGQKLDNCDHECDQPCHDGPCPPCPVLVKGRRCRCGLLVEEAECGQKELVCRRRCNKKKTCGRHKCLDECCDKDFHICDLVCGKKLGCGLHSCVMACHKGACPKCDNVSFDELRCNCGFSVVYPPVACNASPPECSQLCDRQHRCDHPVTHPCHSEATCPPCTSLTEKKCHGGHEIRRNIPCHLDNVSCGRPCGLPLPCGRHLCDKTCHSGQCPTSCSQPCETLRRCGHPCRLPCHDECPQSTCFAQIEVSCNCGRITEPRSCHEFQKAANSMIQQKVRRGEEVNLAKDLSQFSKGFLKCVDRCIQEERIRGMAEAFKIDSNAPVFTMAMYSDFVKDEARKNWNFASKVVNKLNELVELAKNSPKTCRSHAFEPMQRTQRRFVYELLEVYRCSGQSYDQEPKRNIVVTAYKETSVIPSLSLASAIGIMNPIPVRRK